MSSANWQTWDVARKRAHVATLLGWVLAVVSLSTVWISYTLVVTQPLAAAGQQEFDFALLTGTYCNNNGCGSGSTQVTSSSLWATASAATASAVGATFATLFRTLFALTLVPVVVLSALEAVRWLSVYQLPLLPIDFYPPLEPLELYLRIAATVLSFAASTYASVEFFQSGPFINWTSTAREGFVCSWLSCTLYALGAVYTFLSRSYPAMSGSGGADRSTSGGAITFSLGWGAGATIAAPPKQSQQPLLGGSTTAAAPQVSSYTPPVPPAAGGTSSYQGSSGSYQYQNVSEL